MHDVLNSKINIQYEPYNDNQKYELRKQIKSYIENETEEIPVKKKSFFFVNLYINLWLFKFMNFLNNIYFFLFFII